MIFNKLMRQALLTSFVLATVVSCTPEKEKRVATAMDLADVSLIPIPVSVTATNSSFLISNQTGIYIQNLNPELTKIGQYLADKLSPATGYDLEVKAADGSEGTGSFLLKLDPEDEALGSEGYQLDITEDMVTLSANQPAGLFRGVQTIRQLLPETIEISSVQEGPWEVASGTIRDYPSYAYRSAMLDVARHFFSVEDVKRYIDLLAAYKMNNLHLHLTDDQGWRIEIKSWPNLTEFGAQSEVGGGEGGFYTQEQYSELVAYAADRYMTIVPEIDMPGHTNAALSSYPELNCNGKAPEVHTGIEVGFSTLCTDKEITYQFIDDVFRELAAITPGPYLHIGGDESDATPLKDYIPFVNRVQEIVASHGKKVMGWDEVAMSSLIPNSVAQYWKFPENAEKAIEQGAQLLISPANEAYLDMSYDSTSRLGLHWAAYIEVDSAYTWDPLTTIPGIKKENILGIEAPLWSETTTNMDELEWLVFPRLPGHAEIGWSPTSHRDWEEYKIRLGRQGPRMQAMGIDFYPSKLVPWVE